MHIIRFCPLLALILCFATQSIAQMPTSEEFLQRPDETYDEYNQRQGELFRRAGEEGTRQAEEWNENSRLRRKKRAGYIMIAVVTGLVILVGLSFLLHKSSQKRSNEQMLIILKDHLQEKKECPWCKEPAALTQVRCTNCRLEISWYKTIACKPGEEHVGKAVWEYFQREIRKYSRRNR